MKFKPMKYKLGLTEEEWSEVVGWLRNGNSTAGDLAERIENDVAKKVAKRYKRKPHPGAIRGEATGVTI